MVYLMLVQNNWRCKKFNISCSICFPSILPNAWHTWAGVITLYGTKNDRLNNSSVCFWICTYHHCMMAGNTLLFSSTLCYLLKALQIMESRLMNPIMIHDINDSCMNAYMFVYTLQPFTIFVLWLWLQCWHIDIALMTFIGQAKFNLSH